MGWWDDLVDNARNALPNFGGEGSIQDRAAQADRGLQANLGNTGKYLANPYGSIGADIGKGLRPDDPPAPPGVDPEIYKQQLEQQRQAKEFEANAPKMGEDIYNRVAGNERKNLAKQMSGVRNNYSSRGLLYSGLRQGDELATQEQSGSRLASARAGINKDLNDQVQNMNDMAIKSGLDIQQQSQGIQDQVFNQALMNMQNSMSSNAALGGAVGQAAGSYLGSKSGQGLLRSTPATSQY